jgi:ribose transport system substrate-binding protein
MSKKINLLFTIVIAMAVITSCAPATAPVAAPTKAAQPTTAPASDVSSLPPELKNGLTFPKIIDPPAQITTKDPNGNLATWYTQLSLTPEEVAKVRAMHLKVGWELINTSEWDNANLTGFKEAANLLNMEIVATANGDLDPVKQKADMENFGSMNLDVISAQAWDTDIASQWFDPLVKQGIKLVYMSNVPKGYVPGKDYVGAITDSLYDMGVDSADMMADAIGGEGQILSIEVAGVNYVTNTRDGAFRDTIKSKYPKIEIVDVGGFQKPDEAGTITSALLTKYPDVKGIYVSYSTPAISVLEAVKSMNRKDIKIITMDLDTTASLDMAQGGNIAGIAVDLPYLMGFGRALIAAYGALGKTCPDQCYFTSPSYKATKENLADAYKLSFGTSAPQEILDALAKQ